jgi:hypothetical protein
MFASGLKRKERIAGWVAGVEPIWAAFEEERRTSNIERPTSNIEVRELRAKRFLRALGS